MKRTTVYQAIKALTVQKALIRSARGVYRAGSERAIERSELMKAAGRPSVN